MPELETGPAKEPEEFHRQENIEKSAFVEKKRGGGLKEKNRSGKRTPKES